MEKAKILKDLQIVEEERIKSDIYIIETTVQASNEGQEVTLDINNYINKYKNGMPLNSVIQAINNDRRLIEVAEKKALEKAKRQFTGAIIFSAIALVVAIFSITGNEAAWKLCTVIVILLIWVGYTGFRYYKTKVEKDSNDY